MCIFIDLVIYRYIYLSVDRPTDRSIDRSIYLSIDRSIDLIDLSIRLSTYVYVYINQSFYAFQCISMYCLLIPLYFCES